MTGVFFTVGAVMYSSETDDYLWNIIAFTSVWAANWIVTLIAPLLIFLSSFLIEESGFGIGVSVLGHTALHVLPLLSVCVYVMVRHNAMLEQLTFQRGFASLLGITTTSRKRAQYIRNVVWVWVYGVAPILPLGLYFIFNDPIYAYGISEGYPRAILIAGVIISIPLALTSSVLLRCVLQRRGTPFQRDGLLGNAQAPSSSASEGKPIPTTPRPPPAASQTIHDSTPVHFIADGMYNGASQYENRSKMYTDRDP